MRGTHQRGAQRRRRFVRRPLEVAAIEAADLFPTIVTPADALHQLDAVEAGFARLDNSIQKSTVAENFKAAWLLELAAWRAYQSGARASLGWLNTKAVMEQTDKWADDLRNWDKNFQAQGGTNIGPPPMPPGQGNGGGAQLSDLTTLVVAIGLVAAIITIGPALTKG
jgi:hypothetical protein